MEDKTIKNIIESNPVKSRINRKKLEEDIKRVSPEDETRPYLLLAEEVIKRADERGIITTDGISFDLLTDIEKEAVRYIREASSQDRDFLKGDYTLGNYLENKISKIIESRSTPKPPQKKLLFSDDEIYEIFRLRHEGVYLTKIAEKLECSRKTIARVFKNDYFSEEDRERVKRIKKLVWL